MTWHRPNSSAGRITSPFGPRGPIAGAPDASTYHLGVDLRAGTLTVPADVYAAAAGTVRQIYKTPLGAWVLELDHGDKTRTRYVHMQRAGIHVDVGDHVAGGQHVADASNSGAPTVHLHFEVLISGKQIDPVPYLRARGVDLTVTSTTSGTGTSTGLKPGTPITSTPIPPTSEEDDMTLSNEQASQLAEVHWMLKQVRGTDLPPIRAHVDRIPAVHAQVDVIRAETINLRNGILGILGRAATGAGALELDDADLQAIASAVADEQARRLGGK